MVVALVAVQRILFNPALVFFFLSCFAVSCPVRIAHLDEKISSFCIGIREMGTI